MVATMSEQTLICGHKNPDMDCTCAATAYAHLKRELDPEGVYVPIRAGALNRQIRDVYEQAGIAPPEHRRSIAATVGDIVRPAPVVLRPTDPILEAFRAVKNRNISAIPVCDERGAFLGVVSVNEIMTYVLAQNRSHRPTYTFEIETIGRVLPGRALNRGVGGPFDAPIMTGAMDDTRAIERLRDVDQPPLLVVGNRPELLRFAVEARVPAIVITGLPSEAELAVDLSAFEGVVYLSDLDTAETIRLLRLSAPVSTVMDGDVPRLPHTTPFEAAKEALIGSEYRGLPVFRDDIFVGMVTRRLFIDRPRPRLVLVDHNEIPQAVKGADEAEIVEIVDHHRLAAPTTTHPIDVLTRPVGSTCTIVWQEFRAHHIGLTKPIAVLLLSGILSDTVNLHSPTTTQADREAVTDLEWVTGLSRDEQTKRMFEQLQALQHRDPQETIGADFKQYTEGGVAFGIGQAEVTTLSDYEAYGARLIAALEEVARERGLRWALMLITDVVKQNSLLLTSGWEEAERHLAYDQLSPSVYSLPGIVSRKKQLLPEVLRVVGEM